MLCWFHCRVYPDVVLPLQAPKSVKRVGVQFLQLFHRVAWHCPWLMVDGSLSAAWQFSLVFGLVDQLLVLVTLEMTLRVEKESLGFIRWLIVLPTWHLFT